MISSLRRSVLAATIATLGTATFADTVNIYSYRQPELIEPILAEFTAQTGIEANVAFLKKGVVERLLAEGKRSPADLVLTVDIAQLSSVIDAGVTQPINSDLVEEQVPAEFRDPEGNWVGLSARARIIYASKDRVIDGEVTTYEDLTSDAWKGRICTRSGTHEYNLALTSAIVSRHGADYATNWLVGVKDNLARKPQGNDRAQIKAIFAGECDISIGNMYYMGLMMDNPEQQAWADSVKLVFPKFEDGGTHLNVSGIAMTAAAPNKDNAVKLVEFLVSGQGQALYADLNDEYPINSSVPVSDRVASWGTFTPDDTPLLDLANNRSEALRLVEIVGFDE